MAEEHSIMRKVQVIFGTHAELDFQCGRCSGTGFEPGGMIMGRCRFGCQAGKVGLPWAYTYAVPKDMPTPNLWDPVWVPDGSNASGFPKTATVVALTSDYDGPVTELIPNQRLSTGDAPVFRMPNGTDRGAPEWTL
jgi:hypothetical protein